MRSTGRLVRTLALALPFVAVGAFSRPASAQGLQFFAVTPCRTVDTRTGNGGIVSASVLRQFTMKGTCGVPGTAKAVSLNLTIVTPNTDGFYSLWPAGGVFPVVSTINFVAGEPALANGAIVPVAAGTPDLSTAYGTGSGSGQTHVVLDVTGYFQ
ncbi:MAG TPA: hypothetical protein VLJ18_02710 [Thermoanaerobaculia bacterium]|nr:hypothetical protein [Thermoanaerobaculia bacterium]